MSVSRDVSSLVAIDDIFCKFGRQAEIVIVADVPVVDSWQILFITLIVFPGLSNLSYLVLTYRLRTRAVTSVLKDIMKWMRECTALIQRCC